MIHPEEIAQLAEIYDRFANALVIKRCKEFLKKNRSNRSTLHKLGRGVPEH